MKLPLRPCTSGLAFLAGLWTLSGAFTASTAQEPDAVRDKLDRLSTLPMLIAADELGVTEIQGKDISGGGSPPGNAQAKRLRDVPIGVHPTKHENEPSIAANPRNQKQLVAGSHYFGPPPPTAVRCVAYTSADGGATWSAPFVMPQLTALSQCSDPVLAYAPDGSRVYYAYMDVKGGIDWDIVVSYSDDDGQTWTGPILVLDASVQGGFLYDKPWIGTHVDDNESNWVYVTATRFAVIAGGSDAIAFTRSSDFGLTWSTPPTLLEFTPSFVVLQGSRPSGGVGGEVLVAWYNSGSDGWLAGGFEIHTRRSADHGATFDPVVVASVDSYELPFWLGPMAFYHRWWGGMFPDVEIDPGGEAHIVYTHDPVAGSADAEDGDIRYITSAGPPYTSWSSPVTVNDDGLVRAQGYPALRTQHGGESSILHVIWEDHRLSPELPAVFPNSSNLHYDIFYARKLPGLAVGWSSNFRVSDASSFEDFVFIGDYNDLAATNSGLFAIWTDRRDKLSILDFEDDVYGSRIIAGGAAPSTP
jgi:hypothetical protein